MKNLHYLFIVTCIFIIQIAKSEEMRKSICENQEKTFSFPFINKYDFSHIDNVDKMEFSISKNREIVTIKNNGANGYVTIYSQGDNCVSCLIDYIYLQKTVSLIVDKPAGYISGRTLVYVNGETVSFQVRPETDQLMNFSYDGGDLHKYSIGCGYFDWNFCGTQTGYARYANSFTMVSTTVAGNNINLNFKPKNIPCQVPLVIPVYVIKQPLAPVGTIVVNGGSQYTYSVPNYDSQATDYQWYVEPAVAGTIKSHSNGNCTVLWDSHFSGGARLLVAAKSQTGTSPKSTPLLITLKPVPQTISSINGASSVCYSSNIKSFVYTCDRGYDQADYIWTVTGTGASIVRDATDLRKATVTITSATTTFTVKVQPFNGTNPGSVTQKTVTVSKNINIDFTQINLCSGQGDISVSGIQPEGGTAWVDNYKSTTVVNPVKSYQVTTIGSGSVVTNPNPVRMGYSEGGDMDLYLKFTVPALPAGALVKNAILSVTQIDAINNLDDYTFGIYKRDLTVSNITLYKNYKYLTFYNVSDYNKNQDSKQLSLEIRHLLPTLIGNPSYGIYISYDGPLVKETIISNTASLHPTLTITYYTKNTINTNSAAGTTYQVTYEIEDKSCPASDTKGVKILQSPAVTFSAPSYCLEELPAVISGGSSTSTGTGSYSGDNVYSGNKFNAVDPGSYPVKYIFKAGNGCSSEISRNVLVRIPPSPSITAVDGICAGNTITASIPNPSLYPTINWVVDGQHINNQTQVTFTPDASFSGYKNVTASLIDLNGCANDVQKDINVFETPSVSLLDRQECKNTYLNYYPDDAGIGDNSVLSYSWSTGATTDNISILIQQTQNYSLTVTTVNNCSASDNMIVTALDVPVITVNNEDICFGESITLNATPFIPQWNYDWSNGRSGNEISVTPAATGTNNFTVWATDQNGCMGSVNSEVYVNPLPQFTLADQDACYAVPISIEAPPGFRNYTWSTGVTGASSISITPFSGQNISCEVTDANGCSNSSQMQLSVHRPAAISLEALNDQVFCYGSTASLMAPDGYQGYRWSTGSTQKIVSQPIFQDVNYGLTVTDVFGCEANDDIFLNVRQLPVVRLNSPTICKGLPASLIAAPSNYSDYRWSNGAIGYSQSVSPVATTTYELTVTDDLGCNNTFSTDVLVNPTPSFSLVDRIACLGESVNITASGSFSSYLWNTGDNNSSITVVANSTNNYSCTATNTYGCANTSSMTLTVLSPTPLLLSNRDACMGDLVTLEAPLGFNSYHWSNGINYRTTDVFANQTQNYTLSVEDVNGCQNESTMTLFANPYPILHLEDFGINEGETATLMAPTGYAEYLWNTGHTTSSITVNPVEDTRYWVRISTVKGCSTTDSLLVFVYDLPIIDIPDQEICEGDQIQLEGPVGFAGYKWSSGQNTRTIMIKPSVTTVYNLEVTNSTGGKGGTQIVVTVNESPVVSLTDTNICKGDVIDLATPFHQNYSYAWSNGVSGINSISVSPALTSPYSVTVTDEKGCTRSDHCSVNVQGSGVDFYSSSRSILPGSFVQFYVKTKSPYDSLYSWNFGDGFSNTGEQPEHVYNDLGTYNVSLTVITKRGCEFKISKTGYMDVTNTPSGLENTISMAGISIYPVPFKDVIKLDAGSYDNSNTIKVEIYSLAGTRLLTSVFDNSKIRDIDLSQLLSGMYIIKVTVNDIITSKKIVKE